MKNIRRKMVCMSLALVMLINVSAVASAEELQTVVSNEQTLANSAYACNHAMWTWACRKNYIGTEKANHFYGFFQTCHSTVKTSTVRNYCYQCGANLPQFDTNERHQCRQIHNECGKGIEDICTIIGQY